MKPLSRQIELMLDEIPRKTEWIARKLNVQHNKAYNSLRHLKTKGKARNIGRENEGLWIRSDEGSKFRIPETPRAWWQC